MIKFSQNDVSSLEMIILGRGRDEVFATYLFADIYRCRVFLSNKYDGAIPRLNLIKCSLKTSFLVLSLCIKRNCEGSLMELIDNRENFRNQFRFCFVVLANCDLQY